LGLSVAGQAQKVRHSGLWEGGITNEFEEILAGGIANSKKFVI